MGWGYKDEKFWYYGGSLKNLIFVGGDGVHEKLICREKLHKKGGLAKKRRVFLSGAGTPMYTMFHLLTVDFLN